MVDFDDAPSMHLVSDGNEFDSRRRANNFARLLHIHETFAATKGISVGHGPAYTYGIRLHTAASLLYDQDDDSS